MTEASRAQLLQQLIAGTGPPEEIARQLEAFGWDSDRELAVLTRDAALATLDRFLRGELSRASVEAWGDAIESREDIGYEPGWGRKLAELVYNLANPELTSELSPESASLWIERMS